MNYLSVIIFGILCFCCSVLHGQTLQGTIVFHDRTEQVEFDVPYNRAPKMVNYERIQYKVKYIDPRGYKKVLEPHQAKAIMITDGRDTVHLHSVPNKMGLRSGLKYAERLFLRLELDGDMKLYRYYSINTAPGMYNAVTGVTNPKTGFPLESFVLNKQDSWLQLKRESYMADIQRLIWSCPDVASYLAYQSLSSRQIAQMVQEYNQRCGGK